MVISKDLYRGKRIDDGKWVYGYLSKETIFTIYDTHLSFVIHGEPEGIYHSERYEVDPETVGQCTGLEDKNEKRVFDGDIVKVPSFTPDVMRIAFIDGAFCLAEKDGNYVADIHYINHAKRNEGEVIGNIHDNPELLEVEK